MLCFVVFSCSKDDLLENQFKSETDKAQKWFTNEFNKRDLSILEFTNSPDWSNTVISCTELSNIIEVPLQLKPEFKTTTDNNSNNNTQLRLLLFEENDSYSVAIAFITSELNTDNFLTNTNNINYNYIDEKFIGTVSLFNLEKMSIEKNTFLNGQKIVLESKLKTAPKDCYQIVEVYNDGTTRPVSGIYCPDDNPITGGSSGDTSSGGGYGGNPGAGNPGPDPEPKIDTTNIVGTTVECLYKEMRNQDMVVPQTLLDELLRGFEYPNSNSNISYSIVDDLGINTKGKCIPTNITTDKYGNLTNANFDIVISKRLMNNSSFLATANTILHETIHAHLFGVIYDPTTHTTPGENIDFTTTYDALKKKYGNEAQHKIMNNYIEVMKKNLSDLYSRWPSHQEKINFMTHVNEQLPEKNLDFIFEVMARSGLKRTTEGKEFYDANKDDYDMVVGFLDECLPVNCPF